MVQAQPAVLRGEHGRLRSPALASACLAMRAPLLQRPAPRQRRPGRLQHRRGPRQDHGGRDRPQQPLQLIANEPWDQPGPRAGVAGWLQLGPRPRQLQLGQRAQVHLVWAVRQPQRPRPSPELRQHGVLADARPAMHLQGGGSQGRCSAAQSKPVPHPPHHATPRPPQPTPPAPVTPTHRTQHCSRRHQNTCPHLHGRIQHPQHHAGGRHLGGSNLPSCRLVAHPAVRPAGLVGSARAPCPAHSLHPTTAVPASPTTQGAAPPPPPAGAPRTLTGPAQRLPPAPAAARHPGPRGGCPAAAGSRPGRRWRRQTPGHTARGGGQLP